MPHFRFVRHSAAHLLAQQLSEHSRHTDIQLGRPYAGPASDVFIECHGDVLHDTKVVLHEPRANSATRAYRNATRLRGSELSRNLFVRAEPDNAMRVMAALYAFGFGQVGLAPDVFVADDRAIQLGHAPNRVDLLTHLWGVEFEEAWSRRVNGQIDQLPVAVLSRVDLIRNKRAIARP